MFHSVRLGKTRLLLIIQQRHRPLYGSHLQSIMSPRFYAQYASDFNTLASIFVCPPAFFFVFFPTLAFCFSLQRNHFPFRFITLSGQAETEFSWSVSYRAKKKDHTSYRSRKIFHNVFSLNHFNFKSFHHWKAHNNFLYK